MNSRVDRSLASFPRRAFLKTAALAGLSPLAFAQANQDKVKPKHGRIIVLVNENDFSPERTDPEMTGMFAIEPESGVWERVATSKVAAGWFFSSISPNDGVLAAAKQASSEGKDAGIWLFDSARDEEPRRIVDKKPAPVVNPLWSSDGGRLLASFSIKGRENDAAFETFTFRRDGTSLEKLALAETDIAVAWSTDGRSLLVASAKGREATALSSRLSWPIDHIKIDGTGRRRLLAEERDLRCHSFVFSPNGRMFAYTDTEIQGKRRVGARLWIVDLETGKRRRLLKDDDLPWVVRWSADGKTLAVLLDQEAYREKDELDLAKFTRWIELMDLDGKNRRKIKLPFNRPYLCDWR